MPKLPVGVCGSQCTVYCVCGCEQVCGSFYLVQAVTLENFAHDDIISIVDGAHTVLEKDGVPGITDKSDADQC